MLALVRSRLAPFRHRSFRQFFFVQTMSLTGSFAADLARAWIVLQLMGTASALGLLMLSLAIPGLFLILHGGVLVDRLDVRRLMMITKILLALISLILAFMAEYSQVAFWVLVVCAVLEGLVTAFDSPAYQALAVRLVPREDFQQALALNSTNFHASRMLGPLVAGALMALHGPSLVFLIDALTYFWLVYILWKIDLRAAKRTLKIAEQGQWTALIDGLKYIRNSPPLFYKVLQLLLTICLIFPLNIVVFRAYVQWRFGLKADEFGYLFSVPALGSMMGALSFAVIKPAHPIRALALGIPGVALMTFAVPVVESPLAVALSMALVGFFLYLTFASLTVSLQLEVNEDYRGRLGSVIGLCFFSIGPLMGFPIGFYADQVGFRFSIDSLTAIFLVFSAILAWLHGRRLEKDAKRV